MTEKRRGRVLVIDDDRVASDVIVRTLLARGVDVAVVASPDKGIEKVVEERPDLVFVSLFFPESNGLKVSKRIHAAEGLSKVPVVMLISYKGELDPKYTSTIGIVDVLVKPLDPEDVLEKTGRILGRDALEGEGGADAMPAGNEEGMTPVRDIPVPDDLPSPFSGGGEEDGPSSDELPIDSLSARAGDGEARSGESPESPAEEPLEKAAAPAVETPLETEPSLRPSGESAEAGMPFTFEDEILLREGPAKFFAGRRLAVVVAVIAALVLGIGAYGLKKVLSKAGKIEQSVKETPKREVVHEPAGAAVVAEEEGGRPATKVREAGESGASDGAEKREVAPAKKGQPAGPAPVKHPKDGVKKADAPVQRDKYGYSVQVGAFGSERNALSLMEKLKKRGYDAFTEEGGGKVWRVLVGKFETSKQAAVRAKALQEDGFKTLLKRGEG